MRIILILLATFVINSLHAQNFEGKIGYRNEYNSKIPNVSSAQFAAMLGTTQDYRIKGAKYKSITNGTYSKWQLYVPSENRLYTKVGVSDTLIWNDANSNLDKAVKYEIQESDVVVLGYKCKVLVLETATGKSKYYYSKKIKVDPTLFENHQFGNWAMIMEQTKSLALKIEMETPQFTLVSTATSVKEMILNSDVFELPKVPSKKSPY
mgnify:CR=1 FL=1